ncbi:MAG: glycosyltransferase [Patescibacteria group bacterium]|nr:glycosyltransferase [Patescibacteria group bacterium]
MRVLALCDSPAVRPGTAPTGFARVARNIFEQWQKLRSDIEIDIWGIGFDGWGYDTVPWRIFPAGNQDWNSPARLNAFLNVLAGGKYTHVWMLMNSDALAIGEGAKSFPTQLRACCKKHGIKSVLYFPIDCDHQEFQWMEAVKAVDEAVTFTEYGAQVVKRTLAQSLFPVHVIPHGLDAHFTPCTAEEKAASRAQIVLDNGKPFASPEDFLMLNVNKNEWRKDLLRSLEILKRLVEAGVPAKMIFRCEANGRPLNGVPLHRAAAQLGLEDGEHYVQLDAVPEQVLPKLYQACDCYVTTTMGEGWGLGITEALGCGVPVVIPTHTSCMEIGERINHDIGEDHFYAVNFLADESGVVCGNDTRVRRRVDLERAVALLENSWPQIKAENFALLETVRQWLSWERVAGEFLKLMQK